MIDSLRYKYSLARKVKSKILRDIQNPKARLTTLVTQSNMYEKLAKSIQQDENAFRNHEVLQDLQAGVTFCLDDNSESIPVARVSNTLNLFSDEYRICEDYRICDDYEYDDDDYEYEDSSSEAEYWPSSSSDSESEIESDEDSDEDSKFNSDTQYVYYQDENKYRFAPKPSSNDLSQYTQARSKTLCPIIENVELNANPKSTESNGTALGSDSDSASSEEDGCAQYWVYSASVHDATYQTTCESHSLPVILEEHEPTTDPCIRIT